MQFRFYIDIKKNIYIVIIIIRFIHNNIPPLSCINAKAILQLKKFI